jgi:hypothetical protein
MRTTRHAYGLVVEPTFDEAWKDINKPLRIPLPSRSATVEAMSIHRAHLVEASQMATAAQMQVHDYQMGSDTLPVSAALRTNPSDAGGDPAFEHMQAQAQQQSESAHGALVQQQYVAEASARMQGQRVGDLARIHAQGQGNTVIQGERGSAALERFRIDSDAEASGNESPKPRSTGVHHGVAVRLPATGGRVPQPQLRSFRELNHGQQAPTAGSASVREGEDESYETMRLHRVTNENLTK